MSILDALRVQKMNQQSVSQLSALPQNEIIRLAQMGHIPADVVPVVISEKARIAQEMANMQAAARMQQGMPTVIEQAMQTNAQAEQPQMQQPMQQPMPPQQAPAEAGVGALPTGEMFQGQNFQAGGIVAFSGEDESFVQDPSGLYVAKSEAPGRSPSSLADYIEQYKAQTAAARTETDAEKAYAAARAKGSMSAADKDQQKWMRLLEAGLGIMGGKSPYAMQNIAEGAKPALQGYSEDLKAQRAAELSDLKEAADLARTKRQEDLQDIAGGAKLYEAGLDREQKLAIARDSQLGAKFADNYLAMRRQAGDNRDEATIRNEGFMKFFESYGYAGPRTASAAATAAGAQDVQLQNIDTRLVIQAQESVDSDLRKITNPDSLKYRDLLEGNRSKNIPPNPEAAAKFRQDLVIKRAQELNEALKATSVGPRGAAGSAPAPAPAPAAPAPAPAASAPRAAAPAPAAPRAAPASAPAPAASTPAPAASTPRAAAPAPAPAASTPRAAASTPRAAASSALPAAAAAQLKKGVVTTFRNGEQWTLDENGKPKKVN
jgi:hypothetical protein